MGEVYRATDTNLKRQVAIKVLPASVAADAERLARFQREAEVLAALNHPNIAHIHGLEKADRSLALVMELVEGPTLADRIAKGAIPLDEALPIAKQIAEALEAAHEQGIIHRDLKPANVKVRTDGTVKVLDFGLAKAIKPTGATSPSVSHSPTITTPAMTGVGVILGTAAYMAPEQAKGRTADKRSDIWAFGCVLCEMLTGTRAFACEDVTDTIVAVLSKEPDWVRLPGETPPRLRELLRRCLEKDAKRRLQAIGEARIQLDDLLSGTRDQAVTEDTPPVGMPRRIVPVVVTSALGAALVALVTWGLTRPAPPAAAPLIRFSVGPPAGSSLERGGGYISVSPDGRQIVFGASADGKRMLWVRPLDRADAKPLAGTEGAQLPFWSPDGAFLAFFADGKLKKLELGTGNIQIICDGVNGPGGGTWNRDGVIVFSPRLEGPLFRVGAAGGTPTPLTTLDAANSESNHMWPWFLPDGQHYVFQVFGLKTAGIYVGSLDSQARTRLIPQNSIDLTAVAYAPSGHLLFVRNHALMAQPFDTQRLALVGDAFRVAERFGIGGPGRPAFAVSQTGVLVYQQEPDDGISQATWFARNGIRLGTVGPQGPHASLDLSPDGNTIAVGQSTERETSIWLIDVERGTSTRFTSDPYSATPKWSPMGDALAFVSARDTPPNPFVRTLAGVEHRLARIPQAVFLTSWSLDGQWVIGQIVDVKTQADLWLFATSGDKAPEVFLQTPFDERDAVISPDGRTVAFTSDESGTKEVYVTSFPKPGRRVRVSTAGGESPRWNGDGKELFFQTGKKIVAVGISAAATASVPGIGVPRELFAFPEGASYWIATRDGQRFLVDIEVTKATSPPVQVVVNWRAR